MLDDRKREIIRCFAECDMRITATAEQLHFHRNTVVYHLEQIYKKTGLDPEKFYDLIRLLEIVEAET